MHTYLQEKTADYQQILIIDPTTVMPVTGDKNQVLHEFDDGSSAVVEISNQSVFNVQCQWDYRNDVDFELIFHWWHDPLKANGRARTFYWRHPVPMGLAGQYRYYTVRFMTELRTSFSPYLIKGIDSVTLRIEGNMP
jgi:hypothetical protein